jgi:hypothetical protein
VPTRGTRTFAGGLFMFYIMIAFYDSPCPDMYACAGILLSANIRCDLVPILLLIMILTFKRRYSY